MIIKRQGIRQKPELAVYVYLVTLQLQEEAWQYNCEIDLYSFQARTRTVQSSSCTRTVYQLPIYYCYRRFDSAIEKKKIA